MYSRRFMVDVVGPAKTMKLSISGGVKDSGSRSVAVKTRRNRSPTATTFGASTVNCPCAFACTRLKTVPINRIILFIFMLRIYQFLPDLTGIAALAFSFCTFSWVSRSFCCTASSICWAACGVMDGGCCCWLFPS